MVLSGSHLYFMVLNRTAFLTSVGTIWFTVVGSLPNSLIIYISVAILYLAYINCSTTEFPFYVDDGGLGLSIYMVAFFVVLAFLPMILQVMHLRTMLRVGSAKG